MNVAKTVTANYTTPGVVIAPQFSPPAGTYSATQSVAISSGTTGASIRYTTNGSIPTSTSGTLYAGPVSISATSTLKAIAYKAGWTTSSLTTGNYTISANPTNHPPAPTAPAITTTSGTTATSQVVHHDPDAGDSHTYVVTTAATNGVTSVNMTGLTSYTPNSGFTGTDSFVVTVTDNGTPALSGTVTIAVSVNMPAIPWFEDAAPAGARTGGRGEGWSWVTTNPAPFSGTSAHQSAIASGWHYHYFYNATPPQQVAVGDTLYTYVYLDPANPPTAIVIGWRTGGSWEHRAYWGTAAPWGTPGTVSMMGIGALPATGQWVRLEIPASAVGLEGHAVDGMVFATLNGRSTWDQSGKFQAAPAPTFTISGTVTKNAIGLAGVSMTGSTGATCTTPSDTSGNYSCTVPQGWSGSITPSLSGHTFTPASRSYTNVLVSQNLQDYSAAVIPTFTISGTVTKNATGLGGVSFTGNGASCTASASGNYSCTVTQGWSGTITPSLSGHTFTPASRSYVNVLASQTLQDYSATALTGIAWFEDAAPAGARTGGRGEGWSWVTTNPAPFSGTSAHQSAIAAGWHYHYFYNATPPQQVAVGDTLYTYVYLDPVNPPTAIVIGWRTGGSWEHRAYWGTAAPWGTPGTVSMMGIGALPATGQWVRLEIPASLVGLEGRSVDGMVFAELDGRATWDQSGKF